MTDPIKKQRRKADAYKAFFRGGDGPRILKDLIDFCHYNKPTYVIGDPYHTAYNEGMRRIVLRIMHMSKLEYSDIDKLNYGDSDD